MSGVSHTRLVHRVVVWRVNFETYENEFNAV